MAQEKPPQPDGGTGNGADEEPTADLPASPGWTVPTKRIVAVGLIAAVLFVVFLARDALAIVGLAGILAFLVAPLIRFLSRRWHFPRALALATSYLIVFVFVIGMGLVVANGVIRSASEIDPPKVVDSLRGNTLDLLDSVRNFQVFGFDVDLNEAVDPLIEQLQDSGDNGDGDNGDGDNGGGATGTDRTPTRNDSRTDRPNEREAATTTTTTTTTTTVQAAASGSEAATGDGDNDRSTITVGRDQATLLAGGAINSLRTVGGVIAALLISSLVTLLIAVYVNADSHKFSESLVRYVPAAYRGDAQHMAQRVTRIWKGYLYGQLVNSLATGLLVWLVLWAVGLPGAFVLGVIMALLNMIPTFGPILAAVPGVLSAIALGSTRFELSNVTFALIIIGIYVLVVQVQANLMAPFITGRAVRMSPASILIGLLVGVQVAGLVGALLVVPVMATGKELFKYASAKLVGLDPFDLPDDADDADESGDPDEPDEPDEPGDPVSSEAPGGHAPPPGPPGTATETGPGGAPELPGSHRN